MTDVLEKIPAKILIGIVLFVLGFMTLLITYAVAVQNRPIEIWGIKIGETDHELRARLRKIQAESDSKELHLAALARLKEAESKASLPSPESSKLIETRVGSGLSLEFMAKGSRHSSLSLQLPIPQIVAIQPADHRWIAFQAPAEFLGRHFSPLPRQIDQKPSSLDPLPLPPAAGQGLSAHSVFSRYRIQ
jgi:hypothetical protein